MIRPSLNLLIICLLFPFHLFGLTDSLQFEELNYTLKSPTGVLYGTLTMPENMSEMSVALIIPGSGPTDRNGNSAMLPGKNNSLQMLAHALARNGVASVRFDKRGIGESRPAGFKEENLRFDDYIHDVENWIKKLEEDRRFNRIILIGHSEGSLIGIIAAKNKAIDGFISVAGAGFSADIIIRKQIASQPENIQNDVGKTLDSLMAGKTVDSINPMLFALFRPSIQPYLISWMIYDPAAELKKLNIPILILQGDNDLQVSSDDALKLHESVENSTMFIIKDMTHVLKIVEENDIAKNIAAYSNPDLKLSNELVQHIVSFIKKTKG